jgi:hypothetical protein
VIQLSQRAVPPGLIIRYMDETDVAYRLRKADVQHLRSAGVSEQVISYMLSTAPPPYGPVVYRGGYPYPPPYPYGPYGYGPYGYYDDAFVGPVVIVGGRYGHGGWGHGGWGRGGWGGGDGHHH